MTFEEAFPLTDLDRKAREVFGSHVVVKALAQQAAFHSMPRYVTEYLIAKYVRPDTWREDLERVKTNVKELLPDVDRREYMREKLLRNGEVLLIDHIEAHIDLRGGQRWVKIPRLNETRVRVTGTILGEHPGLLLGGMWGTAKVRYNPQADGDSPNELTSFTPFQVAALDSNEYRANRQRFSTDEWLELLLQSAGYAPECFPSRRQRLLLLSRLIPLVERNVNIVELGPRQTGKTFLLRNVSPRVFTVSGGRTTPANLFVNLSTRTVGILGTRRVVVFDEIAHTTFGDAEATVSILKDYMESGQFSRGAHSFAADASIVLAGNLDVDGDRPDPRYAHLFQTLPSELIDSAFLDRVNGYIPGWEIPKISPQSISRGVGFLSDYFGEVLVKLRDDSYHDHIRSLGYSVGVTRRDQASMDRLGSGLIKLVYPDGRFTRDELREVAGLAAELRQRVHQQLCQIAPGEFRPRLIGYADLVEHDAHDLRGPSQDTVPQEDRYNREATVGAVTGLGVITRDGVPIAGDLMIIQVSAFAGSPRVAVTGLHGTVMNDSVQSAYHAVRSRFRELGITEAAIRERTLAVHLVRIAEARDGPSAGLAFVVGLVSALTNRPVKPALAMTGEISLHGDVSAVGGIIHKLRAAAKAGRTKVLIPADNGREAAISTDPSIALLNIVQVRTIWEAIGHALQHPGE